ncbi:MAG: hypothetical protein JO024_09185, partial [Candidatus Eremiobacteraeota bacterium]|nr:hypothetical protein [Candidatus Eremiobacteraeota bacterium]
MRGKLAMVATASVLLLGTAPLPAPNVPLTVAVIDAGGGAQHYDTVTLIHTLAGHMAGLELIRLRMAFGNANVASFVTVFNFAVADIVTTFKSDHLRM